MTGTCGWSRGPAQSRWHYYLDTATRDIHGRRIALCDKARAWPSEMKFESVHQQHRCERCTYRVRRLPPEVDTPESAAEKGEFARDIGDLAERILGGGAP